MTGLLSEETFQAALDSEFSRQAFVKGGGAMVVGFSLAGSVLAGKASGATARATAGPPDAAQIDSWVAVHEDNTATIYFGKINITGSNTGLMQIAAEELDLAFEQVKETVVDTEYSPNQGITAGSNAISNGGPQVRQAAAEARAVLLGLAATRLGVPASQLEVREGRRARSRATRRRNGHVRRPARRQAVLGAEHRAGAAQVGRRLPGRRQAGEADRHAREGGGHATRTCTTSACPGCCTAASCGREARGRTRSRCGRSRSTRARSRTSRASASSARATSSASSARSSRTSIQAATQLKVKWSESATMPGNGNLWKLFREAPNQGERFARNTGNDRRTRSRGATHVVAQSYSIALPVARVVRPVGRDRGREEGLGARHRRDAGRRTASGHLLADAARHEAGAGARAVPRGRGLLRQEPAGRAARRPRRSCRRSSASRSGCS